MVYYNIIDTLWVLAYNFRFSFVSITEGQAYERIDWRFQGEYVLLIYAALAMAMIAMNMLHT